MWSNVSPQLFLDNYLVWVYYSVLYDFDNQGKFEVFNKAFPNNSRQSNLNEIKKFKKISTYDMQSIPIACTKSMKVFKNHETAAIGLYNKMESIPCIQSRIEKPSTDYPRHWLEKNLGSKLFKQLESNIQKGLPANE